MLTTFGKQIYSEITTITKFFNTVNVGAKQFEDMCNLIGAGDRSISWNVLMEAYNKTLEKT